MGALREWVQTLITLVLLAGVLELLVPKGNFKGYVRLTMGLVLVLGMIQPALRLLGQPMDLPALQQRYLGEAGVASSKALQERITAYQQAQASEVQRVFAERLTQAMVQTVRQVEGGQGARVAVQLGAAPGPGQPPPITGVTVWVQDRTLPAVAPIRVDPVTTRSPVSPPSGASSGSTPPVSDLTRSPVGQSVARALSKEYGVAEQVVRVLEETGAHPKR